MPGKAGAKRPERWPPPLEVGSMNRVKPALEVVDGKPSAGKMPLEAAYEHFRLDRMGNRAAPSTLAHYDPMVPAIPGLGGR